MKKLLFLFMFIFVLFISVCSSGLIESKNDFNKGNSGFKIIIY